MSPLLLLALALAVLPLEANSVRGQVVADDGMPLPDLAKVELRCGQEAVASGTVSHDGQFRLEQPSQRRDCELAVEATGYRRAVIATESLPVDPRIPGVVLYRLGKSHGESISASHMAAPPEAVGHFHAAIRKIREGASGSYSEALKDLGAAVGAYPNYAQAWFEIGRLLLGQGDPASARDAFWQALRADPWFVSPYEPLILLLESAGDSEAAAKVCQGLRKINPALSADCRGG